MNMHFCAFKKKQVRKMRVTISLPSATKPSIISTAKDTTKCIASPTHTHTCILELPRKPRAYDTDAIGYHTIFRKTMFADSWRLLHSPLPSLAFLLLGQTVRKRLAVRVPVMVHARKDVLRVCKVLSLEKCTFGCGLFFCHTSAP